MMIDRRRLFLLGGIAIVALVLAAVAVRRDDLSSELDDPVDSAGGIITQDGSSEGEREALETVAGPWSGQRVTVGVGTELAEGGEAQAQVLFLSAASGQVIGGEEWLITYLDKEGGELSRLSARTDARGIAQLSAGDVVVACTSDSWAVSVATYELVGDEVTVVWVSPIADLLAMVSDLYGAPLEGVRASWAPSRGSAVGERGDEALSDEQGRVLLQGVVQGAGTAVFVKDGWLPRRYQLSGEAPKPLHVRMERGGGSQGTRLSFYYLDSGEAAKGVAVKSLEGATVSQESGEPGALDVPSWIGESETLRVDAHEAVSSFFRLSDAVDGSVGLRRESVVSVSSELPAGAERERVQVFLEFPGGFVAKGEATPEVESSFWMRPGDPCEIVLPRGQQLELVAYATSGSWARMEFVPQGEKDSVAVFLARPPHYKGFLVVDESGESLGGAVATARMSSGERLTYSAEHFADEVIRFPSTIADRSVRIGAPGFAPVSIAPPETGWPVDEATVVALRRGFSVLFTITSLDGDPLAGLELVVRQRSSQLVGRTAAHKAGISGFGLDPAPVQQGTTDHRGRVEIAGLSLGTATVVIRNSLESCSDPYGVRLYSLERQVNIDDSGQGVVLAVDRPEQYGVRVVAEEDQLPVRQFDLRIGDEAVSVSGDYWMGWLPSAAENLEVTVPGHGAKMVRIGDMEPRQDNLIVVSRGTDLSIVVRGLETMDGITSAMASIYRKGDDGMILCGKVEVPLVDGRGEIALKQKGDLSVRLTATTRAGVPVKFAPEFVAVLGGGELVFDKED
jgi:hypothetical protein